MTTQGLIQKGGADYKITAEGFETAIIMTELEGKTEQKWVNQEELVKVGHGWMRISLRHLTELFHKEFGNELVSIVLYGSAVKDSFQLGRSDIDLFNILEDGTRHVWQREETVFESFESAGEYKACDYWLKTRGTYGYPEVTMASLQKSDARKFQPIYLDMLFHRAILYDREKFFGGLMRKLEEALKALGTIRIEHPDGTYSWLLKPDMTHGELIQIDLG